MSIVFFVCFVCFFFFSANVITFAKARRSEINAIKKKTTTTAKENENFKFLRRALERGFVQWRRHKRVKKKKTSKKYNAYIYVSWFRSLYRIKSGQCRVEKNLVKHKKKRNYRQQRWGDALSFVSLPAVGRWRRNNGAQSSRCDGKLAQ